MPDWEPIILDLPDAIQLPINDKLKAEESKNSGMIEEWPSSMEDWFAGLYSAFAGFVNRIKENLPLYSGFLSALYHHQ